MFLRRFVNCLLLKFDALFDNCSVDASAVREDMRKLGLTLVTVGLIGFIVPTDKITMIPSIIIFSAGVVIWSKGLVVKCDEEGSDDVK
jgi:hypothetical protein